MTWKIKHPWLALLAFPLFCLFISLGIWQLHRADEKALLLKTFSQRAHLAPFLIDNLPDQQDLRFYRIQLIGTFDNQHTFLLDNKIHNGKSGYEVYTPFRATGSDTSILVDRGFIPHTDNHHTLPDIPAITDETTITGMLNTPPPIAAPKEMMDNTSMHWPLRVGYIDLHQVGDFLSKSLFPYVLVIDPKHASAFDLQWEIIIMSPERHQGYALQWFAFALTLLILFVAMIIRRN